MIADDMIGHLVFWSFDVIPSAPVLPHRDGKLHRICVTFCLVLLVKFAPVLEDHLVSFVWYSVVHGE